MDAQRGVNEKLSEKPHRYGMFAMWVNFSDLRDFELKNMGERHIRDGTPHLFV
jgi:hypothetical protein